MMKIAVLIIVMVSMTIVDAKPKSLKYDQTPLDVYVNAPDPAYTWELITTIPKDGYTVYFINMTSQTWLTPEDSNRYYWVHWLGICVPDKVIYNTSMIYIDPMGSDNTNDIPTDMSSFIEPLCWTLNTVVAEIRQIPNQPTKFADGISREEDAIIAYTWWHFVNNSSEPNWLLRLPMTKAVVKAMDTVQTFVQSLPDVPPVEKFVVAGASKRGWTTWTTAAVDDRVVAFAPIVIPILNIVPNINHHFQAYDGWSFALDDYVDMGIMKYLNSPQFVELGKVVDPYTYLERYIDQPKYVINACGDEFFLPDSPQFFWNSVVGEKHLRMVPNAEHTMIGHIDDLVLTVSTFYWMTVNHVPRPEFTWDLVKSNKTASITVTLLDDQIPYQVKVWTAQTLSFEKRDFRLVVCADLSKCIQPVIWFDQLLQPVGNGTTYTFSLDAPENGWAGFLIELDYRYGPNNEWRFVATTEVNITPDYMPFPPCGQNCQPPIN